MMKKKSNDKISELPESLLHHILSFLPYEAVARTSVLSKKWERAWRTYPVLEFGHDTVFREYPPIKCDLDKDDLIRRNVLFNRLAETMRNRHCRDMVSIKEFTLELILFEDREFASFVDQCICHAVGCNVKKLKLLFAAGQIESYNLPQILFLSNAIEDLELKCCKLELPRSCVKLSSLRKLSLRDVYMDDHTVKNLVCGCPLIECLEFVDSHLCEGFKSWELFGPITLNKIKIVRCQGVERLDINALNVRFLEIHGSPISRKANIVFCKTLTHLKLVGITIKDEWFYTQISKLSVLEVLNVFSVNELKNVKISNPCLKELKIISGTDLVELNIDTPNLHSLHYMGNMIILSANALALSKISLIFISKNVETQRYIELLANFHRFSEVLKLSIDMSEMNVMVPSEVRETIPSPLPNLGVLNFVCRNRPTVFTIAKVVDSLLWFAPHTKTISVDRDECSFEFTYKKQLIYEGEIVSCCKSLPISCWHHCMEAVKVVFKKGSNKRKYTLNGANIWDKIVARCEVWELMKSA